MTNSRTKGHAFERYIASALRHIWTEAKRGLTQSRGAEQPDVEGTPYWIECKHGKRPNIYAAMEQALRDTDGRPPLVVSRKNYSDVLVTMRFKDWEGLVRDGNEAI